MRLIDKEALCGLLADKALEAQLEDECTELAIKECLSIVRRMPEAVVRCRECKHHRDKNEHERQYLAEDVLICTSPDATDDCWNAVWPDHFCSYGERKEGAERE